MGHFRSDDEYIYTNDDYMELYIEMDDFNETRKFAVDYSSYIDTFGILYVGLFENGKFKEFRILNHPYKIRVYAYDTVTKSIELGDGKLTRCRVLSYTKGAKFMDATMVQDPQNALDYVDMILTGKVPTYIPYDKSNAVWMKNQTMNKVGFGIRSEVEEMILSLSYRNPKDLSQQFAQVYGTDLTISPLDFKIANTRQICQYASTFSALTFEDFDTMLSTSINRSRKRSKEGFSPVEEVIKM